MASLDADWPPPPPPPPRRRRPWQPLPWVTVIAAVACLVVYLAELAHPALVRSMALIWSWDPDTSLGLTAGDWWRPLTWQWIHLSLGHLLPNVVVLVLLGTVVERAWGPARMVLVYLWCGAVATAAVLALAPNVPTAGLSGTVFGVAGVILVGAHRQRLPSVRYLAPLVVLSLLTDAGKPSISTAAHLGGLLAGLVAGALLPERERVVVALTVIAAAVCYAVVPLVAWAA